MITYGKLIDNAKKKIDLNGLEHRAIYAFLGEILNVDKTKLLLLKDELVEDNILEKFCEMLADYLVDTKPIEYIVGYTYLYEVMGGVMFSNLVELVEPSKIIYITALILFVIGSVVGMFGSGRAVRKYLKI